MSLRPSCRYSPQISGFGREWREAHWWTDSVFSLRHHYLFMGIWWVFVSFYKLVPGPECPRRFEYWKVGFFSRELEVGVSWRNAGRWDAKYSRSEKTKWVSTTSRLCHSVRCHSSLVTEKCKLCIFILFGLFVVDVTMALCFYLFFTIENVFLRLCLLYLWSKYFISMIGSWRSVGESYLRIHTPPRVSPYDFIINDLGAYFPERE